MKVQNTQDLEPTASTAGEWTSVERKLLTRLELDIDCTLLSTNSVSSIVWQLVLPAGGDILPRTI